MTDKEKKSKIADILLEFYEEYQCNMSNRPMIPSLYASKIIDSLQEEPVSDDWLDMSKIDCKIQYANIESGIHAHAEDYSFNIESQLFNQLTKEQQELWRKEIEQAIISGGHCGVELARDKRYKENQEPVSEELEEACEQLAENARKHKAETSSPFFSQTDYKQGVIDGAKWQKEKDKESIETAIHHAYHNGRLEMKEQMMAKAKSGTVQKDNQVILDNGTYIDLDPSMQLKPSFVGLKEEDRIKVIIIKDE